MKPIRCSQNQRQGGAARVEAGLWEPASQGQGAGGMACALCCSPGRAGGGREVLSRGLSGAEEGGRHH